MTLFRPVYTVYMYNDFNGSNYCGNTIRNDRLSAVNNGYNYYVLL